MDEHDRRRFFALSEQYLLEETAVFATAYDDLGGISAYDDLGGISAYRGDFLKMWEMFIDATDTSVPPGLAKDHCIRLAFNRLKLAA
ncbi:hypothetical protein [Stappia sp.]|uniref:hypothetical protein n=1 Tax=Stappia sp. TaxID=1870903 RepID=UPI003D13CBB5